MPPADVGEPLFGLERPRARDHRRREVDAGRVTDDPREGADDEAAAAGDVEHGVLWPRAGELDDQAERLFVLDAGRGREGHRLAAELVKDQIAVARRRHGALQPVGIYSTWSSGRAARVPGVQKPVSVSSATTLSASVERMSAHVAPPGKKPPKAMRPAPRASMSAKEAISTSGARPSTIVTAREPSVTSGGISQGSRNWENSRGRHVVHTPPVQYGSSSISRVRSPSCGERYTSSAVLPSGDGPPPITKPSRRSSVIRPRCASRWAARRAM